MPRALCLGICLFSGILLSNSSSLGIPELGLLESAKPLQTGFPHTTLQPRNPFQAVSWGSHRAVALEGKIPFGLIYWLYKLRIFGKILKTNAFGQA